MSRSFSILLLFFLSWPAALLAEVAEKTPPLAKVEPFSMMNMLNMVMGLVVVIALILGLAWVMKKYGRLPINNQVDMKILGGLSLGTRERAVLVEVEGRRLLLGVAPGRVATLHVLDENQASFDRQLHKVMDKSS
jgi:flagellar protein FliO/FliZ